MPALGMQAPLCSHAAATPACRSLCGTTLPRHRPRLSHLPVPCRAQVQAQEQQEQQRQEAQQQLKKKRFALGSEVLESNEPFPEPPATDMFEGAAWDWLGKLTIAVVPILIGLTVAVGIFAASTYNAGADKILVPAGEDTPAEIVDK